LKGRSFIELNTMKRMATRFPEVSILIPKVLRDKRGWFVELYNSKELKSFGIDVDFIQDNYSFSERKGTIRGLHFQLKPFAQSKLIRCTKGVIQDVVVDIRKGSPNYSKSLSTELSSENMKQIFIPKGFAHGFQTLENRTEVMYKVDASYCKINERCIRYDDPCLKIKWKIRNPILSDKDASAPRLDQVDNTFIYERRPHETP